MILPHFDPTSLNYHALTDFHIKYEGQKKKIEEGSLENRT